MNIQNLPWLKFAHESYLVSEFKAKSSAIAKAAYFDLLCFAMKQSPALSLPNCDQALAGWASLTLEVWQEIKDIVLSQFNLNPNDNRYYSPMLIELYSEASSENNSPAQQKRQRSSSAERVARHRAKQKQSNADVTPHVTLDVTHDVTPQNVTCNADVTPVTVTLGGKGGDLDLKLENLEKEVVVVREAVQQTAYPTKQTAYPTKQTAYPTTTTKFSMFFDFQIQTANFDLLMQKFDVAQSKNTADNLTNFVGHYLGSSYQNTQAEWELHYVKWLKREKDKPVASVATPEATPNKTPVPLVIVDVKPLWETIAEQKAQREAIPPKDPQKLAAADSAFAEMKKKLGLKAA